MRPTASPLFKARLAGALYVLCIICGFYAEMVVRSKLIVYTDPAATARNILAAPGLYRMGFFADVTAMGLGLLTAVILYTLWKPVSRSAALAVLALDIVSNTVSLCGATLLFAPLIILRSAIFPAFTPPELESLALMSIKLYELSYAMNLAFFAGSCLLTGYIIFRSTFVPRPIGVLLVIAGLCYLINSFVDFMPTGFGNFLFPWILLPCILAEGALALWLLIVGVNSAKWTAFAGGAS